MRKITDVAEVVNDVLNDDHVARGSAVSFNRLVNVEPPFVLTQTSKILLLVPAQLVNGLTSKVKLSGSAAEMVNLLVSTVKSINDCDVATGVPLTSQPKPSQTLPLPDPVGSAMIA